MSTCARCENPSESSKTKDNVSAALAVSEDKESPPTVVSSPIDSGEINFASTESNRPAVIQMSTFLSKENPVSNIDKTIQYLNQQESLPTRKVHIYLEYCMNCYYYMLSCF